jgi:hypothetical protein
MSAPQRRPLAVALFAACAAALSCAAIAPDREARPATGEVELEVWSGFARPIDGAALPKRRVVVLLDATRSMERRGAAGASHFEAARAGAAEILRGVADDDEWSLHVVGRRGGGACGVPERIAGPAGGEARADAARAVSALRTGGEGSIATALREVQTELDATGATPRTRITVYTDLEPACGGDLCAAARAVVEAGGWVDVRLPDETPLPACLAALRPSAAPSWASALTAPPRPSFRVVEGAGDVATIVASGEAGSGPVAAPAGLVALDVDVVPPERIGPFRLAEGELVRVRLLDFPGASPPQRAWQVERSGESFQRLPGVGTAGAAPAKETR